MKTFRLWLQEKWFEHKDELTSLNLGEPNYTVKDYFNLHKYWLKSEYKKQRKLDNV